MSMATNPTEAVARLDLIYTQYGAGVGPKANGTYMNYADHVKIVAELQRRVRELADEWDSRNRLDQSDAQWMREKTYEQCADELRTILAADGEAAT